MIKKAVSIAKWIFNLIALALVGEDAKQYYDDGLATKDEWRGGLIGVMHRFTDQISDAIFMTTYSAIMIAVFTHVAIVVLGQPDGAPGYIARLIYSFCSPGKSCNFTVMYPAFAVAQITLLSIMLTIIFGMWRFRSDGVFSTDEHAEIASRINDLRHQLHLIKVELEIPDEVEDEDER